MRLSIVIIDICWGMLGAVWLAGWIYNLVRAPRAMRQSTGLLGGGPTTWIVAAAAVVILGRVIPKGVWPAITYWSWPIAVLGLAVLIASTLFTLWARWTLGTMWTARPTIKEQHELHTDGPYRITRHPIYTGILAMLFGTMLASGFGASVAVFIIFIIYLLYKIRTEERLLTETFGDRYQQYQHQVPALIPLPRSKSL